MRTMIKSIMDVDMVVDCSRAWRRALPLAMIFEIESESIVKYGYRMKRNRESFKFAGYWKVGLISLQKNCSLRWYGKTSKGAWAKMF